MYRVEVTNTKNSMFNVKSKGHEFTIDIAGNGVTPPDTLLASLASCIGVYIRKYAEGTNLALKPFKIKSEAEFSKEKPVCFREINVEIDFCENELDEKRKASILRFVQNCPVHNTLKAGPEMKVGIK